MFLIAALNDLDIWAWDISNAYLYAPCQEKIWFVGGKDTNSSIVWIEKFRGIVAKYVDQYIREVI